MDFVYLLYKSREMTWNIISKAIQIVKLQARKASLFGLVKKYVGIYKLNTLA